MPPYTISNYSNDTNTVDVTGGDIVTTIVLADIGKTQFNNFQATKIRYFALNPTFGRYRPVLTLVSCSEEPNPPAGQLKIRTTIPNLLTNDPWGTGDLRSNAFVQLFLYFDGETGPNYGRLNMSLTLTEGPNISITGISPALGSYAGGTKVTITGQGFETLTNDTPPATLPNGMVKFGGVNANPSTLNTDLTIITYAPDSDTGLVDISITKDGATASLSNAYQFLSADGMITEAQRIISEMNLKKGISNSLDAKLSNMRLCGDDLSRGEIISAYEKNEAFANSIAAQRGNKITAEESDELYRLYNEILNSITKLAAENDVTLPPN